MRSTRPLGKPIRLRGGAAIRLTAILLAVAAATAAGPLLARLPLFQGDPGILGRIQALDTYARALAAAVDTEIARHAIVVEAIAVSPVLDRPSLDLSELDASVRAMAGVLGTPVAVADTSLAQLANTAVAFGTPLPGLDDTLTALRALESGTVAVSGLASGADIEHPTVMIAVPVKRGGESVAVVATRIAAGDLRRILVGMVREGTSAELAERSGHAIVSSAQLRDLEILSGLAPDGVTLHPAGSGSGPAADGTTMHYAVRQLQTIPDWFIVAAMSSPAGPAWSAETPSFVGAALAALVAMLATGFALRHGGRDRSGEEILTVVEKARRTALESEAEALRTLSELRGLHDTIPVGLALLDRDLQFLSVNAKLAGVAGVSGADHIGRRPSEILPSSIADRIEDAHGRVLATGRPVLEVPVSGDAPGTVRNTRHLLASCHPVRDGEGRIASVCMVLQDVTERIRAEKGRELLVRELNHRVKNTLATVQSIVSITLRRAVANPQQLNSELSARLCALASAHDLLTAHAWGVTDLGEVSRTALRPWVDGMTSRVTIPDSSDVLLRPTQAQAVVLALHELATNAMKHGALSNDEGRVTLRWRTEASGLTTMEWVETGGPSVVEPPIEKRGFGTRLLERALASDLGAGTEVRLVFAPAGLQARISFAAATTAPEAFAA
ncbi:sensor histidine kinase [Humitalea sp. 24SJ18S-53]|uniref:sensor histidine kinase n=1 Tax=Humitalea sp. 24SJ18S-53 TaxID=3422307 RepID=UPI003D66E9ED